ncbi:hypothetical protein Tco_0222038 [Tanacetum coccineum]
MGRDARQQKESSKKQKVEEEKESDEVDEIDEAEIKKLMVIKKDEDIAIEAIPLATKLLVIINYKLHKEGMLVHYELIRADGSSKRPEDEFERVLYRDLKVMFESDRISKVWIKLQGYRVTTWKLIDSSGVHFVSDDGKRIQLLEDFLLSRG